jgi:hypothetical protein
MDTRVLQEVVDNRAHKAVVGAKQYKMETSVDEAMPEDHPGSRTVKQAADSKVNSELCEAQARAPAATVVDISVLQTAVQVPQARGLYFGCNHPPPRSRRSYRSTMFENKYISTCIFRR